MKKSGVFQRKLSAIVAMSLLLGGLHLGNPTQANALLVGAFAPGCQFLFPIGVTTAIVGGATTFGGIVLFGVGAGCMTCMGASAAAIIIPGQIISGLGGATLIAGIVLGEKLHVPPLVRLPETAEFEKSSGLSFAEISEFNDSLEEVAAIDETIMNQLLAFSDRVKSENSKKEPSKDLMSLPEAKTFYASLGLKEEADLEEANQPGFSEILVSKFSQASGLNETLSRVYLKARLGIQ